MKRLTIGKILSVFAMLLSAHVAATSYYDKSDIQQRVINEAQRQNIAPSLALAIAKVESNFNHQALSHAGAKGVMQIMPDTAEQVFGVSRSRLFEPDINIQLGVQFIKQLLERYDDRLDIALSHYNGGSRVKNKYGKLRVMPATRDYVDKVLATQISYLQHDNYLPHVDYLPHKNYLQENNLQQNNGLMLTSPMDKSGVIFVDTNVEKHQTDLTDPDIHSQNPQIETLRALRLHNITRNYKSKRTGLFTTPAPPVRLNKSPAALLSRDAKIAKVRQWESIYSD